MRYWTDEDDDQVRELVDPLRLARGVINGILLGALLWVGIGLVVWTVFHL